MSILGILIFVNENNNVNLFFKNNESTFILKTICNFSTKWFGYKIIILFNQILL